MCPARVGRAKDPRLIHSLCGVAFWNDHLDGILDVIGSDPFQIRLIG